MKNVVRLGMVVAAVSAIVVVLILGCHMGVGTAQPIERDGAREIARDDSSTEPVTGAVVAVPTISPQLVSALNASYEPISGAGVRGGEVSGQALLFAARVELELLQGDEDSEVIAEWEFDNDPAGWELDGTARWERTLEIEPNEPDLAYLLRARVFNDKVSDDVPVVSGVSALFDIVEGETTDVEIIAIPVGPTSLTTDGASETVQIAQLPYEFIEGQDHAISFADYGGEAWFEFSVGADNDRYARIIADPAQGSSADVVMLRYDEEGRWPTDRENDPPAQSWGFFPGADGGQGGTRAGLLHPVSDADLREYIGVVLLNRDGEDGEAEVTVRLDFLERPTESYDNTAAPGIIPGLDSLDVLDADDVEEQTVFFENGGPTVHWFLLDLSDRQSQRRDYNVSITARFDVVEKGHMFGGVRGEDNEFAHHMLALLTFDENTNEIANVYVPLDGTEFTVTEDGLHTTVAFTARVDTQNVAPEAAIAVSSRFAGNRFEISWEPPGTGRANVTIQ